MSLPDLIFIALLALVILGPKKLPEVARQLGKFMAEFKRASNEFKSQLQTEMLNIEMEERAKKQDESPKVLPPEEPWERLMRPISESVSRTRQELVAMVKPEPAGVSTTSSDQPSATSKPAGGQ